MFRSEEARLQAVEIEGEPLVEGDDSEGPRARPEARPADETVEISRLQRHVEGEGPCHPAFPLSRLDRISEGIKIRDVIGVKMG